MTDNPQQALIDCLEAMRAVPISAAILGVDFVRASGGDVLWGISTHQVYSNFRDPLSDAAVEENKSGREMMVARAHERFLAEERRKTFGESVEG